MAEVRWTEQAVSDLDRAAEYIGLDFYEYGSVFVMAALDAVKRLEGLPLASHMVHELEQEEIREIHVMSHRIIFRYRNDLVEVLTVIGFREALRRGRLG